MVIRKKLYSRPEKNLMVVRKKSYSRPKKILWLSGQEAAPANVFVCYFHISNQFLQRGSYKPIRERFEEKEGKMLFLTLHIHTLL